METVLIWIGAIIFIAYYALKLARAIIEFTPSKKDDAFWNKHLVPGANIIVKIGQEHFKIEKLKGLTILKPIKIEEVLAEPTEKVE